MDLPLCRAIGPLWLLGFAGPAAPDDFLRLLDSYRPSSLILFRDNLPDAKAVMVVPVLIKGGFIIGGSGGHGVVLWRDGASGRWSYPSFNFMGSITFGLQIGGEAAEVVLMIRSDKGRRALLSREFKLGGDVSVAAGPTPSVRDARWQAGWASACR